MNQYFTIRSSFFLGIFFIVLLGQITGFAQSVRSQVSVTGKVVEEHGAVIPYATVALYTSADSVLTGGTTTSENGTFEVEADPGNYYVQVKFLSYREQIIPNVVLTSGNLDLGTITLSDAATMLQEAEVVAERTQMELKLDKRVFTVGQDLTNTGSNAAETLDNLPSVNVDVDGNVSLRGSGNVEILINGKPSGLIGMDPANALRQIPSDMIDRIEVITNPSARYQAEGEVGIINIILKKEERKGLNGTFTANAGYPENLGASFNLNFRREKINWFAQYGFGYRMNPGGGTTRQDYASPDTSYSFERLREHVRGGLSHNFRAGADIFLDKTNTLTVSGLYQNGSGNNKIENRYRDFNLTGEQIEETVRDEDEIETEHTVEGSMTHVKKFPGQDHKWETTVNFYREEDTEEAELTETSDVAGAIPLYQETTNGEHEQNFLFQSDYIRPVGEEGQFEIGTRITHRLIQNNYQVRMREEGTDWAIVDSLDNDFEYTEAIYAGYIMYGNQLGKFSYQAGVRAEYSDIGTELVKTDYSNDRDYINFFPSIHMGYKLDDLNSLQLTYSRRLSRPRFRSLLPFSNFSDNRNFYRGNPDLDPEYTDSYEAGFLRFGERGSFLTSIYYRHRTGVIERISIVNDEGVTTMMPVNLSVQDAYGLELNISYSPYRWWSITSDFNFYRAVTTGEFGGESLNADTYTWNARATTKFAIDNKTDIQVSGRYRAPQITPQGRRKSIFSVDVSASRDILKGNGTIALNVRDVFNTRRYRGITEGEYFYQESDFQWRTRQVVVSFTYRLNQQKSRRSEGGGGEGFDGGGEGME